MEILLVLVFFGLIGFLIYKYIYMYFTGMKLVSTDTAYRQRGITVDYTSGTMTYKNHAFSVKMITGISRIVKQNGRSSSYYIRVDIDDIKKPSILVPVIGSYIQADNFMQRICVAVRKAGGPDFR